MKQRNERGEHSAGQSRPPSRPDTAAKPTGNGAPARAPPIPDISLPKGGGAIRGLGEMLPMNPATGSASRQIPIYTSLGRSGFGPQLSLSYAPGQAMVPLAGDGASMRPGGKQAHLSRRRPPIGRRFNLALANTYVRLPTSPPLSAGSVTVPEHRWISSSC